MPGKGTRRITIETLAAGQPRPYADTINHVRVTFEWIPYMRSEGGDAEGFEPNRIDNEEMVRDKLKGLQCGFTDFDPREHPATMDSHFRTRLDWLKQVEPHVWEFHTTSPYTD